jgi:hypothetical protein
VNDGSLEAHCVWAAGKDDHGEVGIKWYYNSANGDEEVYSSSYQGSSRLSILKPTKQTLSSLPSPYT